MKASGCSGLLFSLSIIFLSAENSSSVTPTVVNLHLLLFLWMFGSTSAVAPFILHAKEAGLFPKSHDPRSRLAHHRLFDAIVVGGGAAGCPLARTLADSGKEVLLIERGGSREEHPSTMDIYGAGWVIDDRQVSQLIITEDGIRSHIASVLSGGTGINMGIVISEVDEFLNYLETFPGVTYDREKFLKTSPYGDAWRQGLRQVFGPMLGYQVNLGINASWQGYSVFDSENDFSRKAADATLGTFNRDFPPTLHVLLRHTVHKIEFERNPETSEHRATCVILQPTTPRDLAPILSDHRPQTFGGTLAAWLGLNNLSQRFSAVVPVASEQYRACVKPGGKIISSAGALTHAPRLALTAGAILTPILLYKSGVGPRTYVERSGASVVKEFPEIGRNLKDRVLIPISLFFKDPLPTSGFPPTITQAAGFAHVGINCTNFGVNEKSLRCSAVTAEELSGAGIAEGTLYSTRLVVPPNIRNDPVVSSIFQVLQDCGSGKTPLNNVLLTPLCSIALPISRCFRRVATNFYFTAEPKSTAQLEVLPDGHVSIRGNYLKDPQDLEDAMRGIATIIRVVNSAPYDGVFEEASLMSCPAAILNGLVNLMNHRAIQKQLRNSSSRKSIETAYKFFEDQKKNVLEETRKAEEKRLRQLQAGELNLSMWNVSTPQSSDFFIEDISEREAADSRRLEATWLRMFGSNDPKRYYTSQRFATYPPTIPGMTHSRILCAFHQHAEPSDEEGLKEFAKAWMTSIWHWVGSAPMGVVVDQRFKMFGFENLHIVDASVLNQVTRMNPTINIVALGRYAGLMLQDL